MYVQYPKKCGQFDGSYSLNASDLSNRLKVVTSKRELEEVRVFRNSVYSEMFPGVKEIFNDPYDEYAVTLFTRDSTGNVSSTGRLAMDGPLGLPEEHLVAELVEDHRRRSLKLAEYGRLIIREPGSGLVKDYYKSVYLIALHNGIDSIIVVSKRKDVYFYEKLIGTKVLSPDVHETFGSDESYACLEWKLNETRARFFRWCHLPLPNHFVN